MNRLRTVAIALGFLVGIAASRLTPVDAWADRNSGGTYTLPSGNPVVSGTTITSTWANNTLNDIATNLTSSLDRAGRGAMTAPLQLASGTSSAPGLTFSAETSTGLYRFGSNDARMQVASTTRQKWTSTGAEFPTERVMFSDPGDGGPAIVATGSNGNAISATSTGTAASPVLVTVATKGTGIGYEEQGGIRVVITVDGGVGVVIDGHLAATGAGLTSYSNGIGVLASTAGAGTSTFPAGLYATATGGAGASAVYGHLTAGSSGFGGKFQAVDATVGVPLYAGFGGSPYASAATRYDAIRVENGDIRFTGTVIAPNPNASVANSLTASNIVKAWGQINLAGPPVLLNGYGVASISCASNVITVNWQNAFTGATAYVVQPTISANDVRASVIHDYSGGSSASNAKFAAFDNAGTIINLCAAVTGYNGFTTAHIDFTAIGHQ